MSKLEKLTINNLKYLTDIQSASDSKLKYLKIVNANSLNDVNFIHDNKQLELIFNGNYKKIIYLENLAELTELIVYYV